MTIRNLEGLFAPSSIAVVGPPPAGRACLDVLLRQLSSGGFKGAMTVIGCGKDVAEGFRTKRRLADLDAPADLLIMIGPPRHAPHLIAEAGERGTRAAIALSTGFEAWPGELVARTLQAAKTHTLRLLGPGSLGLAAPHAGLAAHIAATPAIPGDLALIARSSAVLNATLSWAAANRVGFSGFASLGQRTDVDVGDLLDWFALDYRTRAVLVHLETIANPRKFLSAARACARTKPVIVMRSGRSRDRRGDGVTHSGRLAAPDAVFDAALQRSGILRVDDLDEMFEAAETVTRLKAVSGRRLAILATGGSLATIAADQLAARGGELASIAEETLSDIGPHLRGNAPRANPLILGEHARPETFEKAVGILMGDPSSDGVMVVAAPSAFAPLAGTAEAIARGHAAAAASSSGKKALVVALAAGNPLPRAALDEARIPCYASSADAVRSFMHLAHYMEAKAFLMAAPPSLPADFSPDTETARAIVERAMGEGREWLGPGETCRILDAYAIPRVETRFAATPEQAAQVAEEMLERADRLVLKIAAPRITFKSDVGGVVLDIASPAAAEEAARSLIERLSKSLPEAGIAGVVLQPMKAHPHSAEVFVGLADDPLFGPAMLFGHGGTAVEVVSDLAIELPPLDLKLAEAQISRTRIDRLLAGFRSRPPADRHAVALTLVKLSQIAVDIPEIREFDINPLIVDAHGVEALDARVRLGAVTRRRGRHGTSRLAIAPYPKEWEETLTLKGGRQVFVRPVRPEDEALYQDFFDALSPEDLRLRFFAPVKEFSHTFIARLVQLDYARAMAFAALDPQNGQILGVVRLHADPDHLTGEYAIIVRSALKGLGLGWALMQFIIRYAAADGIETIKGEVLKENSGMLAMCEALGFSIRPSPDDDAIAVVTLPVAEARNKL